MNVSLRWLGVDEIAYGQGCVRDLWRKNHILTRNKALFSWFYRPAPGEDHLGFLVAEAEGIPVGCIGRMAMDCHVHGEAVQGAAIALLVVDAAYRTGGVGLQLLREAYANQQLVVTFGINDHVARIYRMLGQHILNPVPRYVCVANCEAMAQLLVHTAHAGDIDMDHYACCGSLAVPGSIPSGYTVSPLTLADLEAWDQAWHTRFAPNLQGVARNARYLRWRYLEHPDFRYVLSTVRDSAGEFQGFSATRLIDLPGGVTALRILDFLASGEKAAQALAQNVAAQVPDNAAFVEYVCLGGAWSPLRTIGLSPEGSDLFSVYFSPPDYQHRSIKGALLVKIPGINPAAFATSLDTYITIADGDQDRPN